MSTPTHAISLLQPWASLVVGGKKHIETRSWRTPILGPLAIHASKGFPMVPKALCDKEPFRKALAELGYSGHAELPRGAILGHVTMVGCVSTNNLSVLDSTGLLTPQEKAFGDYGPNRWLWVFEDPVQHDEPRLAKGALSVWRIPT